MILGMTLHDRQVGVVYSVLSSLCFPGNRPEAIAVCFDRTPQNLADEFLGLCGKMGIKVRSTYLRDAHEGFRCPSRAWNAVFDLVDEDHLLCISSDVVLAPHSIGMAVQMSWNFKDWLIVGRAEHCGPSYHSYMEIPSGDGGTSEITSRVMTSSVMGNPLGFAWVLPMKIVREIGGYSDEYMKGICFEDDDFVIRMWEHGTDILFVDDILALHIEHPRPHVLDEKKVKKNQLVFAKHHGGAARLEDIVHKEAFRCHVPQPACGLTLCCHEEITYEMAEKAKVAQRMYGHGQDWISIPVNTKTTQ